MAGGASRTAYGLPAVVGEGLVGLRHAVDVVLALPGAALLLAGVEDLAGEPVGHRLLAAAAGQLDEPAAAQRPGPSGGNLDRHRVGRTADSAGANLERRGELLDRLFEDLDGRAGS